jgi:hypothetical protein
MTSFEEGKIGEVVDFSLAGLGFGVCRGVPLSREEMRGAGELSSESESGALAPQGVSSQSPQSAVRAKAASRCAEAWALWRHPSMN